MKPAVSLCLACLLTLTACGGQTQPAPSTPSSLPEVTSSPALSIPLTALATEPKVCTAALSELPDKLVSGPELWSGESLYLLVQLPDEDIFLYGDGSGDGLILRKGDSLTAFELSWLTPRSYLPQLYSGDFDGDNASELLLLTYTGSGTGVSSWTLTVFEDEGDSWKALTLPDLSYDDDLTPLLSCEHESEGTASISLGNAAVTLTLEDYVAPDVPLEPYTGTIVDYWISGNSITAKLAVGLHQEDTVPYTLYYPAVLSAELVYDGQGFALVSPALSEYSD